MCREAVTGDLRKWLGRMFLLYSCFKLREDLWDLVVVSVPQGKVVSVPQGKASDPRGNPHFGDHPFLSSFLQNLVRGRPEQCAWVCKAKG